MEIDDFSTNAFVKGLLTLLFPTQKEIIVNPKTD